MPFTVILLNADFSSAAAAALKEYENSKIISALKKAGANVHAVSPTDTFFGTTNNHGYTYLRSTSGIQLSSNNTDAILVRRTKGLANRILEFCMYSRANNPSIVISDPISSLGNAISKVYSTALRIGGIRQPDTYFFSRVSDLPANIPLPVVYKPIFGRGGVGIVLCKTLEEISKEVKKYPKNDSDIHMVQEYIPIKREFRALVVGDQVVGCVEKPPPKKGIARNSAYVSGFKKYDGELLSDLIKTALRATHTMEYDICGVDLVEGDDGIYVLECNRSPQFQSFDIALECKPGTSIAAISIADFLVSRIGNVR